MRLQAVRAIYKDRALIFADPELAPRDGTEVVVTFLEEFQTGVAPGVDPIQALRGRGKGERLVERLLQSRREDRERDERSHGHLRT
jgi:hypothetical protein